MIAKVTGRAGVSAALMMQSALAAQAHSTEPELEHAAAWTLWSLEPGVILPLLVSAILYAMGSRHMPRRYRSEHLLFWCGWTLLVVALVSPVHRLGSFLFSVHMTQHELLMIGAAPLLVLGRPGLVMLRAFPGRFARGLVATGDRTHLEWLWVQLTRPAVAWAVHAFALWAWHIPSWFEATLRHEWIHALQHASFFGTALWFWFSVFHGPRRAADYGWGVLNLFLTAVHSSVLGALITFAPRPWYPSYVLSAPTYGLSGLEDQQLGGLVMWVPAALVYILAALALLAGWLRASRPAPDPNAATPGLEALERQASAQGR